MAQLRKKNSYGLTKEQADLIKAFNQKGRYVEGFRQAIGATTITPQTITLSSAGHFLLGITIIPITGVLTTLADCAIKLIVNNKNILLGVNANNINPNFVQNMIFYPTPAMLVGKDSITVEFNNQGGATTVYTNVYYIPQPGL